jgi:Family of unknown function (DUF6788)
MADTLDVPAPVRILAAQVAEPTPMRRGSLSERYVKCSKPGCACAERPTARHGPYYSLTRTVGGRTQSRFVPAAQTALVRQQIAAGQQFRRHVDAFWDACERWADAQLAGPAPAAPAADKKGASRRPSRPKSSPRSTRS